MKKGKIVVPIVVMVIAALVVLSSGVLTVVNPFISTSAVSRELGGSWSVQNYYSGNNTVTEILIDSQGNVLVITQYSFPSVTQAQSFFYANSLGQVEQYENYLISYYSHGLSESLYILNGGKVYYISYVATTSTSMPSISQLLSLIK
ncbi:hypothetical protein HFC64_10100 [Saccharolobus solfataricus]|uniref:DUF4367 domain-containing protein n=2 Tax=Saccharolobus solfataricus TaxID=2287 RepID=Q97UN6_SACS2|nr:hypothetical protein [Saccharolobus solfataricus]AAK43072.1 Hypothetical protein SSO2967 [Saccharolobus solfataricus P2]QPG50117.1 hypothetical protein HFC64_10100 [Saccharolobus solfataricus]SAI86621.1 uncharacterised protein [Saccharolobus solfataricus]